MGRRSRKSLRDFFFTKKNKMRHLHIPLLCLLLFTFSACDRPSDKQADSCATTQESAKGTDAPRSVPEVKAGAVNVITEEQFTQWVTEIDNPKGFQYKWKTPAIVDCYADWCRPCQALNPILVEIAKKYGDRIIVYKLNVDKAAHVSQAFAIEGIPCLLFFKADAQPAKSIGFMSQSDLEKAIDELLLNE